MASLYDEIESDEEGTVVPRENLLSAAQFMLSIFEVNHVNAAALGGFAFIILGRDRATADVDICVEARFKQIRQIVEHFDRLRIPRSKLVSGVLRVYCWTGKQTGYDDCREKHLVQIDIKECGEGLGPRELGGDMTMLNPAGPDGSLIRTLNYTHLLRAKMKAWDIRQDQKFDSEDIKWLLEHHGEKIDASQLNKDISFQFIQTFEDKKELEQAVNILGLSEEDDKGKM